MRHLHRGQTQRGSGLSVDHAATASRRNGLMRAGLLAAALTIAAGSSLSHATTINVSKTGDNANDGLTWVTAKSTVTAGLSAAGCGPGVQPLQYELVCMRWLEWPPEYGLPPSLSTDTSFESPGIGQGSEVPLRVRVDREDNIWVFTAAVVVPGDQGRELL